MTNETTSQTFIPYEDMLKAGMHFGRRRTVFHPAMREYVFTIRDGICIIDLLKTQAKLSDVGDYLTKMLKDGKLILFVAPTKQSCDAIKSITDTLGMPYVLERWLGGTLTNFKVIMSRVKKLQELEKERDSGELDKYTKKERLVIEREIKNMEKRFGGLRKLSRMPDALFIASFRDGESAIAEAKITHIPVVGIGNTDSNMKGILHVIPANDRSKKSVDLIISTLEHTLKDAKAEDIK